MSNSETVENLILQTKKLVQEQAKLHLNDPRISENWDKLTDIIGLDLNTAQAIINSCNESELYYVSEVFEDISAKLQSEEFISFLLKLQDKYPDLDMETDIYFAKKVIGLID